MSAGLSGAALREAIAVVVHLADVDVAGDAIEQSAGRAPYGAVHSSNGRLLVIKVAMRSWCCDISSSNNSAAVSCLPALD